MVLKCDECENEFEYDETSNNPDACPKCGNPISYIIEYNKEEKEAENNNINDSENKENNYVYYTRSSKYINGLVNSAENNSENDHVEQIDEYKNGYVGYFQFLAWMTFIAGFILCVIFASNKQGGIACAYLFGSIPAGSIFLAIAEVIRLLGNIDYYQKHHKE